MNVFTMILGGGIGRRLSVLGEPRGKAALPFGGKYRIVDFVLSNAVNSRLEHIAVLAQFSPQEMISHLGTGEPWGLNRGDQPGIQLWMASAERTGQVAYLSAANAVYQNRKDILAEGCDTVLILAGDHVYKQDFRDLLRFHQEKGADATVSSMRVPIEKAHRFGLMGVDDNQRIVQFEEQPQQPAQNLASLGIYVFNTAFLLEVLEKDAHDAVSRHDFGLNILPKVAARGRAFAYPFNGYWEDVGNVQAYYETHLALLEEAPPLDLFDPEWVIHTRLWQKPPVKIGPVGKVERSLVSDGCVIHGEVAHSVLSPGVRVERGAVVRDSVILQDTVIRAGAVVDHCVVDEAVEIGAHASLGAGYELAPNAEEPDILNSGITVIGRGAVIPPGAVIGHNCRVDQNVVPRDFERMEIPCGSTVHKK